MKRVHDSIIDTSLSEANVSKLEPSKCQSDSKRICLLATVLTFENTIDTADTFYPRRRPDTGTVI